MSFVFAFRDLRRTRVPLHLMCIIGARRWSACKPHRSLRCRRRPPASLLPIFFPLCLLAESWSAGDILQRGAPLFFWVAYARSCSRFLRARHALLTLVNYTSRRSAATGGMTSFILKDSSVIYPAGIRPSELTIYRWLIYQPVVFDLGAWTCHWDHMVLFGGRVCVLEDDSRMVGVEGRGGRVKGGSDVQKQIIIFLFCLG